MINFQLYHNFINNRYIFTMLYVNAVIPKMTTNLAI